VEATKVLIGIQARSTSKRFPNKIFELIGPERVLDHVVGKAKSAANHINRYGKQRGTSRQPMMNVRVALLIPYADKALYNNFRYSDCLIIEGPEDDVLARYVDAQRITDSDFIVRLTADCPLLLDYLISKHINVAVLDDYDYVSNVDEACRTIADGFDCEVISRKALDWLNHNAVGPDREHVTSLIRSRRPEGIRQAVIMSKLDTSHMKMSIDTPEDLNNIRRYFEETENKKEAARRLFGHDVFMV
jgi:spore coat polysaccharide biosynthesis protein SpsF